MALISDVIKLLVCLFFHMSIVTATLRQQSIALPPPQTAQDATLLRSRGARHGGPRSRGPQETGCRHGLGMHERIVLAQTVGFHAA